MVLFGKIANNVNNKDLFHRKATDNIGWIKLRMEVNMQEWNIHCILNRSKNGNVSLSTDLYKGVVHEDNSITKSRKSETLKFLAEEVIKSDADTFRNAVILSTSNIQNFFQLPKPAKDAYLDSVFTLAAFGQVFEEVKKAGNRLKRELSSQREIFEGIKTQHKEILDKSEAFLKEKDDEFIKLNNQINVKANEIKELKAKVIDVDNVKASIETLQKRIKKWEAEIVDLNVERAGFAPIDEEVSILAGHYADERNAILDEKLKAIDADISSLQGKINEVEKIIPILENKVKDFEGEVATVTEKIEKLRVESKDLGDKRSEVCNQITVMMNIKKKFESTYELLCTECQKKTTDHFEFDQEKYDALEASNKELLKKEKENCESFEEPNGQLNTFKESIVEVNAKLEKATKGIELVQGNITEFENSKTTLRNEATNDISKKNNELYEEARKALQSVVDENTEKVLAINKGIDSTKDAIRDYEAKLTEAKSLTTQIEDGAVILKDLVDRAKVAKDKPNPFESLVKDGKKKLDTAKDAIGVILKDQRKYELLSNIYDENGVKKHIVANIVASLNILIKKYLAEMGTDYTVIFDDKFKYNFYTSTGECDYWSFSSGERRRLDMAVMLALRDILFTNGLVTNILIVDEVLDSGIDGYALYAVLNILKNKTKDSNLGCIVISHRTEIQEDLSDTFDRTVLVVKENGESKIVTHND
jgi:DNA repair exonuclease SbcCD ATPase subunit